MYVHSGILSDPCELNVNWSGKIQQLLMCSTAEEEHTFCLIFFLPPFCLDYFLISFLYPVCHKEKVSWHTRFNSGNHCRVDHTGCIKDKLWIRTASEGSCNQRKIQLAFWTCISENCKTIVGVQSFEQCNRQTWPKCCHFSMSFCIVSRELFAKMLLKICLFSCSPVWGG